MLTLSAFQISNLLRMTGHWLTRQLKMKWILKELTMLLSQPDVGYQNEQQLIRMYGPKGTGYLNYQHAFCNIAPFKMQSPIDSNKARTHRVRFKICTQNTQNKICIWSLNLKIIWLLTWPPLLGYIDTQCYFLNSPVSQVAKLTKGIN